MPERIQQTLPMADLPTPVDPGPRLSADMRRTVNQRELIDAGYHPLTKLPLYDPDDVDATCGTCVHHQEYRYRSKTYHKCDLVKQTRGPGTDLRVSWPACQRWVHDVAS